MLLSGTELLFGTENLNQFLSPSCGIVCLIRMPLVKSFCHTRSAQMEKLRGEGGYHTFQGFSFLQLVFLRYKIRERHTTFHEIFAGVGSGMFTLETNRPLDMDEPCLAGKVIITIHSRVTLM